MWQPDGWGSRARIGVLTPHNDVVPESELRAMAPPGISIHSARVRFGWHGDSEAVPLGFDSARAFAEPPLVDDAAELLAGAPLDVIAYAFTSSSYLLTPEGDAALRRRLETRTRGVPVLIPCLSAALALRVLGARKLALVHPPWFTAELDRCGADYFAQQGFDLVYAAAARLQRGQLNVEPAEVYDWVSKHVPDSAEAVFVGGNGFRAVATIQALEEKLGRPVLTANQGLLWHALRLAQVEEPVVNYGRIFTAMKG